MLKHFVILVFVALTAGGCATSGRYCSPTPVMDGATNNALALHGGTYSEQGANQAMQTAADLQAQQYQQQADMAKVASRSRESWNREQTRRQQDILDYNRDLAREQTRRQENITRAVGSGIDRGLDFAEEIREQNIEARENRPQAQSRPRPSRSVRPSAPSANMEPRRRTTENKSKSDRPVLKAPKKRRS